MKLFKRNRRMSVVYTWFFSILSVIVLILLLNLGINFSSLRYMEKEMLNLYENSTNLLKTTVDTRLSGVQNIVNQLGINTNNIALMNSTKDDGSYRKYTFNLIQEMQAYKIANPLIKDIFVYYPSTNNVVSSEGLFQAKHYYYISDFKNSVTVTEWNALISDAEVRQFEILKESQLNFMIVKHTLPISSADKPKAVVIAVINETEVKEILTSVKLSISPKLTLMLWPSEKVYSYSGDDSLLEKVHTAMHKDKDSVDLDDYLVTSTASQFGNLTYLVINTKSEVLNSAGIFRIIAIVAVLICLIFGGALALFISRKNNSSIIKAVNSISKNIKRDTDEYTFVTSYLSDILNEKSLLTTELEKQKLIVKRSLLIKMLKGETLDNETVEIAKTLVTKNMALPFFSAVAIYIEDIAVNAPEGDIVQEKGIVTTIREVISNYQFRNAEICIVDGNITLVINLQEKDDEYGVLPDITKAIEEISKKLNKTVKAGIGSSFNFYGLTLSYYEANEALEHAFENESINIFCYSDIEKDEFKDVKPLFSSVLAKLEQMLKSKALTEAEQQIEEIFTNYLTVSEQPEILNCRKYAYINLIMDTVAELQHNKCISASYDFQAILNTKNYRALKQESINIVQNLKAVKEQNDNSETKKSLDTVKRYIDENYTDPDLNLNLLSEKINMNHTQLSKLFKRYFGYGISEYINKVRIDAAKILIRTHKLTIKEIAIHVGYSSDINFIRVFKKYENVTPGNYGK